MTWLNYHHLRYFWAVAREGNVSRAARGLRLAQPTVSEQLRALEESLGEKLLERAGRGVVLTEVGRTVYRFADEIFALGRDMQDTLAGRPTGRQARLVVGIADMVPKLVAFRVLEPALRMEEVRLVCHEGKPDRLLDMLAAHELDLVLADAPLGLSAASRAYDHLLGECRVALVGVPRLAAAARRRFPQSLAEMPMLLPTAGTALRRALDAWLDEHGIVPRVVGEFQDSALALAFCELGTGLMAAPDAIVDALAARGLRRAGTAEPLRERYYAISVERKLRHPAAVAIAGAAREQLFTTARKAGRKPAGARRPR
jgi:LysR family transcriptional activator of nhaA